MFPDRCLRWMGDPCGRGDNVGPFMARALLAFGVVRDVRGPGRSNWTMRLMVQAAWREDGRRPGNGRMGLCVDIRRDLADTGRPDIP